ncbi:TetR/AcrR family transcriptional regulator [Brevibacillus parabrevis]|uniref:TetR/AcrR family transcriptional regulator n=1 Tax=Brevibacillus parabrevis TaxID=54914 RepID=UPI002E1EA5E6|nr:TetR family transcriptional regulator C-terminal domain-containing protein [Brevibacillus parabrevis]
MPKQIDHEKRREQIAEATWRVISERGMEGATVRNIAAEAGLSLGALRHYFSTQDELLMYSMKLVKERATARIQQIATGEGAPAQKITSILLELVPTNQEKLAEVEVWFAFTAYFRHKKEGYDAQHDGIYSAIRRLMDYANAEGLLEKELDMEMETEKLYALIDGLALHAYLEPQRIGGEWVEKVLREYLARLFH